jgi:hypothetical protein
LWTLLLLHFVSVGVGSIETKKNAATESLIFMAVGLTAPWKIPISYYLTNGLTAEKQRDLVLSVISALHEVAGIRCVAVVMDGHATNQRMVTLLGGFLAADHLDPVVQHPSDAFLPVYLFFDACHLIKNIRNSFGALGEIDIGNGHVAKWSDIVMLQRLQDSEGLRAANRLTKNHIDFKNQIMKVKLAVQTLSSSVASALLFCQQIGCIDSSSTDKTAEFISVIDRLFDIFNSKCPVARGYKSPIRPSNVHLVDEL